MSDRESLTDALAKAVGWEASVMDGVTEAICNAGSQAEIDSIVQDYLGGDDKVRSIVARYQAAAARPEAARSVQSTAEPAAIAAPPTLAQPPNCERGARPVAQPQQRPAGSLTVTHAPAKRRGKAGTGGGTAATAGTAIDREHANCLCCGKVFDCRPGAPGGRALLEAGGRCTFCGARVALRSGEAGEERPPAAARRRETAAQPCIATAPAAGAKQLEESAANAAAAAGPTGLGVAEAADSKRLDNRSGEKYAEAVALRDRLVEYDRTAARRTAVVDDQSDFFEIDANAWLTREERELLKEQDRQRAEAEAVRRRRVTVTIDLMGRQVLLAEDPSDVPGDGIVADAAAAAAAATAAERPQGGGTGAAAAAGTAAQLRAGGAAGAGAGVLMPIISRA